MPSAAVTLNPPRDEQVFEDLCLDLFAALWDGAQLYGRRGHYQKGIDIYGQHEGGQVAVQCKKREGKLYRNDVERDIEKARKLKPALARLTFATTAQRDPFLQDFERSLAHGKGKPPFAVEIWFWDDLEREIALVEDVYRLWEPILGAAPPLVSVDRLPSSILPELIGRQGELGVLEEAWGSPEIKVQSVVAVGGAGKTALVHHWMQGFERAGWKSKGAAAAFAWSFYSQGGGDDRQATGEPFIDEALRFFGERDRPQTPRDRGLRLAELVRRRRTLLILDGLEPLQHPPSSAQAGKVKDPAVAALIGSLAADNPGLLLLTSREPVAELQSREGHSARTLDLEKLSSKAGAALLRWLGVQGKAEELEKVSEEVHWHAFTLTILGTFLRKARKGDVRAWKDLGLLQAAGTIGNTQAGRVMVAYVQWFDATDDEPWGLWQKLKVKIFGRPQSPERQILSLLGLFDRPADGEALQALRRPPAISGLTDRLVDLGATGWDVAVEQLRDARLLLEEEASGEGSATMALDAHPLVREHFGRELEKESPEAYREGHLRLYRHYAASTDDLPNTLEAMQPLYLAIGHGCRAGRRQEVYDEVYWRRVRRGNEAFSVKKLGAFGADLGALAGFFERTWDLPARELRPGNRSWLLNAAAFRLRALGRLAEAVEPMAAGLQMAHDEGEWKNAAIAAGNLSELSLTLGRVDEALGHGRRAVELAERSGGLEERITNHSTLGEALHAAGELEEAQKAFRKAEVLQEELSPQYPKLYSLRGYSYCDLLLSRAAPLDGSALGREAMAAASVEARGACEEVRDRALLFFDWRVPGDSLLDIALDHLNLGRATLGLALAEGGDLEPAAKLLHEAVRGLRAAGTEDHLPRGLLARATLHRFRGDGAAAEADLAEALEIAERGLMKLHECDAHLEWARLRLSLGDREGARGHWETARALVAATGYHRRDREVGELEEALTPRPPLPGGRGGVGREEEPRSRV